MKKALAKALESRMRSRKIHHAFPSFLAKSDAHESFKAMKDKKKLPTFKGKPQFKDEKYSGMSMKKWEKKYLKEALESRKN